MNQIIEPFTSVQLIQRGAWDLIFRFKKNCYLEPIHSRGRASLQYYSVKSLTRYGYMHLFIFYNRYILVIKINI